MRIWIVRLNATLLTEYAQQQRRKKDDKEDRQDSDRLSQSSVSSVSSSSSKIEEVQVIANKGFSDVREEAISHLIDHSRKLPLAQYENELNYTEIRNRHYYYFAKHSLLFICCCEKEYKMTIAGIQSSLKSVISLYQEKMINIHTKMRLPNYMTDYQRLQLRNLRYKIKEIVEQQEILDLERMDSVREENQQDNFMKDMHKRMDEINDISVVSDRIREKKANFLKQTENSLQFYQNKLYLAALLTIFVITIAAYCIYLYD